MTGGKTRIRRLLLDGIAQGRYRPGTWVKVNELAALARLSPIPVRETLAHLVGQDILEEARGIGFMVPRRAPHELEQIYRLRALLAVAAVPQALDAWPSADQGTGDATIWTALVGMAGDKALAAAWQRTEYALLAYRRYEPPPAREDGLAGQLGSALKGRDIGRLRTLARSAQLKLARSTAAIARCAETGAISNIDNIC